MISSRATLLSPLFLGQQGFERSSLKEEDSAITMQRRWPGARGELAAKREAEAVPMPDLTDFMNDSFFGTVRPDKKVYNLSGGGVKEDQEVGGKIRTSRLTQEWLEEAKRMVASSPARRSSPARTVGSPSPRFASPGDGRLADRRDPFSRSARRNRAAGSISDEILSKTSHRQGSNIPESFRPDSPSAAAPSFSDQRHRRRPSAGAGDRPFPPRLRKSRFQDDQQDSSDNSVHRRSSFNRPPSPLLEPKNPQLLLSPPRSLVESAQRRSISSSTCSQDTLSRGHHYRRSASKCSEPGEELEAAPPSGDDVRQINSFLRRQRTALGRISCGEVAAKAKIILSGSATSTTSSMVAAICYAWLLGHAGVGGDVVAPVVNMKRGRMSKHRQAAWLFHQLGIDASALLFADEVDLEGLIMSRQFSILVVGQDVLKSNGEVGSLCTVLTDNYCEESYNLLQTPNLKKLMLAGILLDTQNLNSAAKYFTNRDSEAVQLLLFGSAPNYRHELFEQLMQDHRESSFLDALRQNYGRTSNDDKDGNGSTQEDKLSSRRSASISPQEVYKPNSAKQNNAPSPVPYPAAAPSASPSPSPASAAQAQNSEKALATNSRARKNKFSLAKLFGFGSK